MTTEHKPHNIPVEAYYWRGRSSRDMSTWPKEESVEEQKQHSEPFDLAYEREHLDWLKTLKASDMDGISAHNLVLRYERLFEQLEAMRDALREADRLARVTHTAIWDTTVEANGRLHDNDDELSAQTAIWQLHHLVRPLLGEVSSPASEPS